MLFRALGTDENKIHDKIDLLLNAKRIKRSYVKGDMMEEIEEEDTHAIEKGIGYAIKLTDNEPSKKHLVGEDPNNRFSSLADGLKAIVTGAPIEQLKED